MFTNLLSLFSAAPPVCKETFFGLKTWYHYLKVDGTCSIVDFQFLPTASDGRSDFLLILLALVDDLLRVAGLVAIGFVIYGGILYVTSQGSPDQTQKAQSTIQNALIGLVVAILAVAFVSFLGSRIVETP